MHLPGLNDLLSLLPPMTELSPREKEREVEAERELRGKFWSGVGCGNGWRSHEPSRLPACRSTLHIPPEPITDSVQAVEPNKIGTKRSDVC